MASQLTAVMGRRVPPSRTSELAARATLLPAFYREKEDADLRREGLDLSRDAMTADMSFQNRSLAQNQKAAKDAINLGKAKLGVSAALGAGSLKDSIFGDGGTSTGTALASAAPMAAAPVAAGTDAVGIGMEKASSGFNMPSLKSLAGAVGGGYAGYKLGGDSKIGKVAGAAGGALIGDALAGGSLYKDIGSFATQGISHVWTGVKSFFGW